MTVDWYDLAGASRWFLVAVGVGWIAYAWWKRIAYPRAILGLAGLALCDYVAHAWAAFAERPDSIIPTDFSLYSLWILLAAGVGLAAASLYAYRVGFPLSTLLDAALVVVLAGGIGARAFQVLIHWDYYMQNTSEITNLTQGGMGWHGGFILGGLAFTLFAFFSRSHTVPASFWKLADAAVVGLALAQGMGWYAALLVGANYGVVTDSPIAQDLPDVYGIVAPRVPVQTLAMLFFFILCGFLCWMAWQIRPRAGTLFLSYLILAALAGWTFSASRADETLIWNGWRIDQWVDAISAGVGLCILGMRIFRLPPLRQRGAR